MRGHATLFLLSIGSVLVSCSHLPLRRYHYIDIMMTWYQAQEYCRQHHTDLATFESMEEVQQHQPTISYTWAWIGLIDNISSWQGVMGKEPNSWRWSATGDHSQSGYQIWGSSEPNYGDRFETCVLIDTNGEWQDKGCHLLYDFVCFTGSALSPASYQHISIPSSWNDAQAYCRQYHTDLAVIESSSQNTDVYNSITPAASAWIGLHRVPWTWSDHSLSTFRNWQAGSPNYPYQQHFAATDGEFWDDDNPEVQYGVLCQTVSTLQTSVRVVLQTGADITLPVNYAQILQKVDTELTLRGWTHFRLAWRNEPVKQIPDHKWPQRQCRNF